MASPARNRESSAGEVIEGTGGLPTVIWTPLESVLFVPSDTVRRAVYVPAA